MSSVQWRTMALEDRERIAEYIAGKGSPTAARKLDVAFMDKAHEAAQRPNLYKAGRMRGTRELALRPNYVMVYRIEPDGITILRVLHAAQQ